MPKPGKHPKMIAPHQSAAPTSAAPTSAAPKLSAADCARRTGLTVRALRVYERAGLLEPARSAKGWRLYGPDELIRLNTIVALKGLGLSLRDIRKAFGSSPPALVQVLDLQMRNWAARRMAADRSISLIQAAIGRLQSRADLTIDELCELMRNTEVNNVQAIVRELINQHITPEQEREWLTFWSRRDPKDVLDGQQEMSAFRAIGQEFYALMKRGEAPDSPAVQEVQERSHQAWLNSNLRQRQLEQLEWNPEVTRAWFALGAKLLAHTVATDSAEEAAQLDRFIHAARQASRSSRLLTPLVMEAVGLREAGASDGEAARELAQKYQQLCRDERLGDPNLLARWVAAFGPHVASRPGWELLARLTAAKLPG